MATDRTSSDTRVAPTVVRPVVNAIALLRHLGETGNPATVTQLARLTGINTSTCFNILRTLVAERMLVFDEAAKTYQIGLGAVELAQNALSENGRVEMLRPLVEAVARQHGITLTLWRLGETERHIIVGVSETETPFSIQMQVGLSTALFHGAIGRSLVSERGLTEEEIDALYPTLRWAQAPGLAEFKAQVAEAEARGWGFDDGEFARGVTNIGVVVPRASGPARYGLVATMFHGRFTPEETEAVAQAIIDLAREISGIA